MTRRVLVTGAASGIGAALCARLAEQGVEAIGLDRQGADITCDLASPAEIMRAVEQWTGPLHGIAHVAGLSGTADPAAIVAVNTRAPRLLTDALADRLASGGAVVAVSSVTAARCPLSERTKDVLLGTAPAAQLSGAGVTGGKEAYELSKALLERWVLHAAHDFAERQVRVVAVAPGPVETPLLPQFRASIGADRIAAAEQLTGRHARAEEIAAVIAFLLSPDASWINGTVIRADGGYHAFRALEEARLCA